MNTNESQSISPPARQAISTSNLVTAAYPIIELVVYQARVTAQHPSVLIEQTNRGLARLPGYDERRVFRATNEPTNLVDWVSWDTLDNALQGAKSMKNIPELVSFVELIDRTNLFDHFRAYDYHNKADGQTDLVELVIYELKPDMNSSIHTFFQTYSEALASTPGYHNRTLLQSTSRVNRWVEWVHWGNLAAAQTNEAAMQTNTALSNVFSMVETIVIKQYIQPYAL